MAHQSTACIIVMSIPLPYEAGHTLFILTTPAFHSNCYLRKRITVHMDLTQALLYNPFWMCYVHKRFCIIFLKEDKHSSILRKQCIATLHHLHTSNFSGRKQKIIITPSSHHIYTSNLLATTLLMHVLPCHKVR